jgi:uncharacterized NAD(P)/FAD-binding protein YdhS
MSPEVSDQLSILIEDRTLVIHRGRLVSAKSNEYDVTIVWKSTETGEAKILNVARIINCTGPSRDITRVQSSLVVDLLDAGLIRPDPLQLGLEIDPCGRPISKNRNVAPGLYTLGPLRIAGLWESIAIPEIRNQALDLAKLIVSETIDVGVPT